MKKHFLLRMIFLVTFAQSLNAQPFLSKPCNNLRGGDKLIKQQVEYKDPGDSGENVCWDFSKQKCIDDRYRLSYRTYDDSLIVGQEHRTLYKYIASGDTIFSYGFENPTTLVANSRPEIHLAFPLHYGDKHENYFHGNGDYCNRLFLALTGVSSIEADAYGVILLPSGDTLRQVLRVRQSKKIAQRMIPYNCILPSDTLFCTDSTDYHLATDSLTLQSETYRWYADGYRYPVFETIETTTLLHEKPVGRYCTAFYYTPADQYYDLANDPENQLKRDTEQARLEAENSYNSRNEENKKSPEAVIRYHTSLSDDGNTLLFEYCLNEEADVSLALFDIQSRQLTQIIKMCQPPGTYTDTFSMSGLQPGEYTLRIVINGKIYGEKIIK